MKPPLVPPRVDATYGFDLERQSVEGCERFTGVTVLRDIVSPAEERELLRRIGAAPFVAAQSGKRKQHFGIRANFKRRRLNDDGFAGLPPFAHFLEARVRERAGRPMWRAFEATDVFVLRYDASNQANLDFHVDDGFVYGDPIAGISLESASVLRFVSCSSEEARCVQVAVPLPRRSAILLSGAARTVWQHGVAAGDIDVRRTSITLRTLAPALRSTRVGKRILARTAISRAACCVSYCGEPRGLPSLPARTLK